MVGRLIRHPIYKVMFSVPLANIAPKMANKTIVAVHKIKYNLVVLKLTIFRTHLLVARIIDRFYKPAEFSFQVMTQRR